MVSLNTTPHSRQKKLKVKLGMRAWGQWSVVYPPVTVCPRCTHTRVHAHSHWWRVMFNLRENCSLPVAEEGQGYGSLAPKVCIWYKRCELRNAVNFILRHPRYKKITVDLYFFWGYKIWSVFKTTQLKIKMLNWGIALYKNKVLYMCC